MKKNICFVSAFLIATTIIYCCVYNELNVSIREAERKYEKERVLCWIMTAPANINRAFAVKATWGRHCDILIFISTEYSTILFLISFEILITKLLDSELPTVAVNATEGYNNLWGKTQRAFEYVYSHH